jgi:hypothetical protein
MEVGLIHHDMVEGNCYSSYSGGKVWRLAKLVGGFGFG